MKGKHWGVATAKKDSTLSYELILLIVVAFILRVIMAIVSKGHETDVNCFLGWSEMIYQDGFSHFYASEAFTDYPPGYMYFLYVIGWIRNLLGIPNYSVASVVLVKMPAIICDLVTGYFIYKLAKDKFHWSSTLFCCGIYLLNPAIFINSAIWGQVDSVFTLFVVLMCYFIMNEKLSKAYLIFAIGILIKPQTLIFTPVLILGIVDQVFLSGFQKKKFLYELGRGVAAIGLMVLLVIPFGLQNVIGQYTDTIESYPYASVNAYNIWTMFGLNWGSQEGSFLFFTYSQWGTFFIVLIVITAVIISLKSKKDPSKYFFIGAFIVISVFLFSVRMHERYMFPALALLLMTYIIKRKKEILVLYGLFSMAHFLNVSYVLWVYDYQNFNPKEIIPIVISILSILLFGFLLFVVKKYYFNKVQMQEVDTQINIFPHREGGRSVKIKVTQSLTKLTKFDLLAIILITGIYAVIALYDLGDRKAPTTNWETATTGTSIVLELGEKETVKKIGYYLGNYEKREFSLESSDSIEGPWNYVTNFTMDSVFSWGEQIVDLNTRYLRLTSNSEKAVIGELVIVGEDNQPIAVGYQKEIAHLFDEQEMYPERSTFRDSTYFDEIYHARTGYEYIHGLYSYENTHPPLGKIFIAIGMMMFGVNPFGWRIMGTLFGILMVPLFYLFTKKVMKESWISILVTLLFTFDFMHFAQTRIATIDVFVTFFIILMYYFMYQYTKMSFYDTSLKKTFIPLRLCGIAMGLGVASKWTGAYAGIGLAIIFLLTMIRRYQEYLYAKKTPNEKSGNIEHQFIIDHFKSYMIKTILFCIVFFVIIPIIIYVLSYIPFVDSYDRDLVGRMLKNQETMFNYHSGINAEHPYSSWWYQWPSMYRPIWYYSGHVSDTISEGISAFGNPLVWWAGIPAFFYMVFLSVKKKDKNALFLMISYLAQYVPWFLVTRITFIYHYFPSVPFVALMVGYSIYQIVKNNPKMKKIAYLYVAMVVLLFVLFYPVLSGQPIDKNFVFSWLRWFPSWVLVS